MNRPKVEKNQNLLPAEKVETAKIKDKNSDGDLHLKGSLPLITCECGSEFLLLPDLRAMSRAIKTHTNEHMKKERNTVRNGCTSGKISQLLSQFTLTKISEKNNC
jgi:hypothetical protein